MTNQYVSVASEINLLEGILSEIPDENVIEKISIQSRIESAKKILSELAVAPLSETLRLTFRGKPVLGRHGIGAEFGTKAAAAFNEAYSAIIAALNEQLNYMGPIPDKTKHQLLITGTAVGSFGFEFELPPSSPGLFRQVDPSVNALELLHDLLRMSADGSDDDVAEIVDTVHPRAVRKVADFLAYVAQQQALCGLEFKNRMFRFKDSDQLNAAADRLQESNIHQEDSTIIGKFVGALPFSRTFEYELIDGMVIKGKIDKSIDDPDVLNREWLNANSSVVLTVIRVGEAKPRYHLRDLSNITAR